MFRFSSVRALGLVGLVGLGGTAIFVTRAQGVGTSPSLPLTTTLADFFQPGTQENTLQASLVDALNCANCHGHYNEQIEPFDNWVGSMMAQATRDPVFHAALAIANQDASFAGELCLRCHTPAAGCGARACPPMARDWMWSRAITTESTATSATAWWTLSTMPTRTPSRTRRF
jgi:hypothetical protein